MKKFLICLSLLFSFCFISNVKAAITITPITEAEMQTYYPSFSCNKIKEIVEERNIDTSIYDSFIINWTDNAYSFYRFITFFNSNNIYTRTCDNSRSYCLHRDTSPSTLYYNLPNYDPFNSSTTYISGDLTYKGATKYLTNNNFKYSSTGYYAKNYECDITPQPSSYTVNFHLNGGNVIDLSNPLVPNMIELDYQIETTTSELLDYLEDITIFKDGYTFGGWYYDANLTQAYSSSDTLSSNIDLYAKWIPNPNITFHLNGGLIRIYNSESSNNSGSSGGGSSTGGGRHEDQIIYEDYTIKLPLDEVNDYIESLTPEKYTMIFEGWYYDANYNTPYHVGDSITTDTSLYAKWRYESVDDFLDNTAFTEHTFDTNYGYAIISRGNNTGDIYLGLSTNNYDITVYQYNKNLSTYSNEQGYCLVPIYSKESKYYYLLNGDITNYLDVLVLPKTTFENGDYKFYLTNNANVEYTNNLQEVVIYDESGNQITTNLQDTYTTFQNSLINDEKDLITIFKNLINFKDNKVFENIESIWNKFKATDLYIYFLILIITGLIIAIIRGARRN